MQKAKAESVWFSCEAAGAGNVDRVVKLLERLYANDRDRRLPLPNGWSMRLRPGGVPELSVEFILPAPSSVTGLDIPRPAAEELAALPAPFSLRLRPHRWRALLDLCRDIFPEQFERQRHVRRACRDYTYRTSLVPGLELSIWIKGQSLHLTIRSPQRPSTILAPETRLAA